MSSGGAALLDSGIPISAVKSIFISGQLKVIPLFHIHVLPTPVLVCVVVYIMYVHVCVCVAMSYPIIFTSGDSSVASCCFIYYHQRESAGLIL